MTPIEDTAVEWKENHSPAEPVATLTIRQTDITSTDAQARGAAIERPRLQPVEHHRGLPPAGQPQPRPQGGLRRQRSTSKPNPLAHRSTLTQRTSRRSRPRQYSRLSTAASLGTDCRYVSQCSTSTPSTACYALATSSTPSRTRRHRKARPVPPPIPEDVRVARTADGRYNDLSAPEMGAVDATFGRNLKPDYRPDLFNEPNPITVSDKLLAREHFLPARSLNLIAAAWIQFQVHDWAHHARHPLGVRDVEVPLPQGIDMVATPPAAHRKPMMRIAGNKAKGVDADGTERLFANAVSHWWDGSEVYGSDARPRWHRCGTGRSSGYNDGYLPT